MSDISLKRAKIIVDEPATADAFSGGGHQRLAHALADAIEQLANQDGAIGLEGKWGSGKSTVIRLADEILKKRQNRDRDFHLFTFDLWAHQSDDFRRAFLEAFVTWLEAKKLLEHRAAQKARDRIRDRQKTIRHENSKHYNPFGLIFLLIAPILPIAYAWLSPFGVNLKSSAPDLAWVPAAFLIVVIAAYGFFLFRVMGYRFSKEQPESEKNWLAAASKAISMFSRDVDHETTTQNIRETDPTTIEFHDIFRDTLKRTQNGTRRTVLVLDNIDRLPKSAVPLIWSEVRSLFAVGRPTEEGNNSFVTAVIPYDEAFVASAFDPRKQAQGSDDVRADFIEKTFSRVLRVAPPVATDWRAFLQSCLNYAFEDGLGEDTIERLFRTLRHHFQTSSNYPTPREIIRFVNEIGTLWSQWGELIPVESLALYVIHRPVLDVEPASLRNPNLVDQRFAQIANAPEWQRHFAALSFNVEPERANEVFLAEPIAGALTAEEADQLAELAQLSGFREVLPDVLHENIKGWAKSDYTLISKVAKNLDTLDLDGEVGRLSWEALFQAVMALEKVSVEAVQAWNDLLLIAKHQPSNRVWPAAYSLVSAVSAPLPTEEARAFEEGRLWLHAMEPVWTILSERLGEAKAKQFMERTEPPKKADAYLGAALACSRSDHLHLTRFRLAIGQPDIRTAFGKRIAEAPSHFSSMLVELQPLLDSPTRVQYLNDISASLQSATSPVDAVSPLLHAFAELYIREAGSKEARAALATLVTSGTLAWHGQRLAQANDNEVTAIAHWLTVSHSGTSMPKIPDNHQTLGSLVQARDWYNKSISEAPLVKDQIESIAGYAGRADQFTDWAKHAIGDPSKNEFFRTVFRAIVNKAEFRRLQVAHAIENYAKIADILGADGTAKFLGKFCNWSSRFREEVEGDRVLLIPDALIADIVGLESSSPMHELVEIVDEFLKSRSEEEWEDAFAKEDDRLRLLIGRRQSGDITLPTGAYRPALLSHALLILQGGACPRTEPSEWHEVIAALKPATRKAVARDIVTKLSSVTVASQGAAKFISFYWPIATMLPLSENADVVLEKLVSQLIYTRSEEAWRFFADKAADIRQCIEIASSPSRSTFEEAIQDLEDTNDESDKSRAQQLRELLNLERRIQPSQEAEKNGS